MIASYSSTAFKLLFQHPVCENEPLLSLLGVIQKSRLVEVKLPRDSNG